MYTLPGAGEGGRGSQCGLLSPESIRHLEPRYRRQRQLLYGSPFAAPTAAGAEAADAAQAMLQRKEVLVAAAGVCANTGMLLECSQTSLRLIKCSRQIQMAQSKSLGRSPARAVIL